MKTTALAQASLISTATSMSAFHPKLFVFRPEKKKKEKKKKKKEKKKKAEERKKTASGDTGTCGDSSPETRTKRLMASKDVIQHSPFTDQQRLRLLI